MRNLAKPIVLFLALACMPGWMCLAQAPSTPNLEPTSRMRTETRYIVYALEQLHYNGKPISSLDIDDLIVRYLGDLDLNHLFFYQSDVDELMGRFSRILPVYLKQQGNLYPAFEMFKVYQARVNERMSWIRKRLGEPFEFDSEQTYRPDRRKSSWPADEHAANELWEKRLKYELLNEVLIAEDPKEGLSEDEKEEPKPFQERLAGAIENLSKRYKRLEEALIEIEAYEVQEIFLSGLTHMYDPHSMFMSSDTLEEFSILIKNSLVGIGAMLYEDEGYCTVRDLIPGGPAEKSKQIESTDRIVGVSQGSGEEYVDVIGMRLKNIVKLIRGKEGSPVHLLIQPANSDPSNRKEVILIRGEIKLTSQLARAELFEVPSNGETLAIGVISLPGFYGSEDNEATGNNTSKDVEELIVKLKALGAQGIILDLRRNGGGLLTEAIELSGLFIGSGPVVQVQDTLGQVSNFQDTDKATVWDGPMIVMVSRSSASASEIVAGALKNHKRAIIFGDDTTHGKGTVQGVYEMDRSLFGRSSKPQMGAAKITIQKFYLPDGSSTQIKGVPSDISIPSISMYLPIAESDLDNPLEWDSIAPMQWSAADSIKDFRFAVTEESLEMMRQASLDRQDDLDEFEYLRDSIDWLKAKQEQKEYSLRYETRQRQRQNDLAFKDSMEEKLKSLGIVPYVSTKILLDVAQAEEDAKEEKLALEKDTQEEIVDQDEDGIPDIDISLRESLRLMTDWIGHSSEDVASSR